MASPAGSSGPMPDHGMVADRYAVHRELGRGGMAVVLEATDQRTGERVALKRLEIGAQSRRERHLTQLFEREYHTLSQLAHPRIVQVYDYALSPEGPYYTMELLDGGDLHALAPMPWQEVCALARDVCSALSLLHSRRMVHRDISARNIRRTSDGLAKLIDFGAMVPMGPTKYAVGTPPFCAPEAVLRQPLDGRTDLFALGAAMYYALTARHAFGARDFATLQKMWRNAPIRPSDLNEEIPGALDGLVLDLLSLDPNGRPASAAEAMQRLAAVEGVATTEHAVVAQAYLSTPRLVGRSDVLERLRRTLRRAAQGQGSAAMVEAPSGAGRSRVLDACALDARVAGLCVLRANADDASEGEYGVARALARQLLQAEPVVAQQAAQPHLGVLGHMLPELLEQQPEVVLERFESSDHLRPRLQRALRRWLLEAARRRPLFIAVDDLHQADEPSTALVAVLADHLKTASAAILVSADSGAAWSAPAAGEWLSQQAAHMALDNLDRAATRELLASIFGEVPHLDLLTHRLYEVSLGNPRDIMRLAHHLLERDKVRYEGGAWSLPASLESDELPSSMAQALRDRVEALQEGARELARALALRPEHDLSFDECLLLSGHTDTGRLQRDLDELMAREIVKARDQRFALAGRFWLDALACDAGRPPDPTLHLRFASVFERRADHTFHAAQHRLCAGQEDEALDMLVTHARESQKRTDESPEEFINMVGALPHGWAHTYDQAIKLCERSRRPAWQAFALRSRLAGIVVVTGSYEATHVPVLLDELARLSGLDDYRVLDPSQRMSRLERALARAQQRYDQTPAAERVLEPGAAIQQLARTLIQAGGMVAAAFDLPYLNRLPSLEPLVPLSPALEVIHTLIRGIHARITGHRDARRLYLDLLQRLAQPDGAGLDESHRRYTILGVKNGLGILEAALGLRSALDCAAASEQDPLYQVGGMQVRYLYHLWQGDLHGAEAIHKDIERVRIQSSSRRFGEGNHLTWQIIAHALCDDLTRTQETLREIDGLAARHAGWQPVQRFGQAAFHRIRGDHASSLQELEAALAATEPGEHLMWPALSGAYVATLGALGHHAAACARGARDLESAEAAELGELAHFIRMPLAVARAQLGQAELAREDAEAVLREVESLGCTGLRLALAHETRARVALALGDHATSSAHLATCSDLFTAHENPVLAARAARLAQAAERAQLPAHDPSAAAPSRTSERVRRLETLDDSESRLDQALSLLLEASAADLGVLYTMEEGELRRRTGTEPLGQRVVLETTAQEVLRSQLDEDAFTATGCAQGENTGLPAAPSAWRAVILCHHEDSLCITGIAMLHAAAHKSFRYPSSMAKRLSAQLYKLGDVTGATSTM